MLVPARVVVVCLYTKVEVSPRTLPSDCSTQELIDTLIVSVICRSEELFRGSRVRTVVCISRTQASKENPVAGGCVARPYLLIDLVRTPGL